MGVCMFGCCSQTVQLESVFAEQQPPAHPDAWHCNWSSPVKTGILDATSRTCAGPMPRGQGVWMLGNANDRNHLVLSVAPDGRNFSRHWIVRSGTPSPRRLGEERLHRPGVQRARRDHDRGLCGIDPWSYSASII